MSLDWTRLAAARSVIGLTTDPRPAWLWSGDGNTLLWRNRASALFGAKVKKSGLKRVEDPRPIKGQIARVIRLGLFGRATLSRVQFLAGRKPLSATCTCTPLMLGEARPALLIVGVDPIARDILEAEGAAEALDHPFFTLPVDYALFAADGTVLSASPGAVEQIEALDAPSTESGWSSVERDGQVIEIGRFDAGPDGARLVLLNTPVPDVPEIAPEPEPELPQEPVPDHEGLSALVDRLAGHDHLFAPLDDEGDALPPIADAPAWPDDETNAPAPAHPSDWDEDHPSTDEAAFAADEPGTQTRAGLWQLTGRGFAVKRLTYEEEPEDSPPSRPEPADSTEGVERTSRYNFEELSRILTDRIGRDPEPEPAPPAPPPATRPSGALVALSDETLVLNRLPLGILIFRDQDILFANRALVELTGFDSATTLRGLGLAAIFPTIDANHPAGPVTQLMQRDGGAVSVSARLQTISWQGRNAFMLSARTNDNAPLHEAEVKDFAQLLAKAQGAGFFEADASGTITVAAFDTTLVGQPVTRIVAPRVHEQLKQFFNRPARFAGTERPNVVLDGLGADETVTLFAEGRAGIVSGYFGIVAQRAAPALTPLPAKSASLAAPVVGRISRELRQPLNTILGFSELIAGESFGPLGNDRYLEYARDIGMAGQSISVLADELDDFVRLAEGTAALSPADIDLSELLADCLSRVRKQAGAGRVLLRSAISERLPHIRADAGTLRQAVLNLLASAIDQTAEGGKVVLSAQRDEDGSVQVHVRDSSSGPNGLADHFVVFREGADKNGEEKMPVRSSIGLTLTRSLVAVNACSLSFDPANDAGTLMTLLIPAELVVSR